MKSTFLFFLFVLGLTAASNAQLRINLMGGFANYAGDLQAKAFTLKQSNAVVSAGATYNLTRKFYLRSEFSFAKLGADDKFNTRPGTMERNLNFKTNIKELSVMGEYDLNDLTEKRFSPYVFTGLSLFHFNPYTYNTDGSKVFLQPLGTEGQGLTAYADRKMYKRTQLAIPMGAGIKYALSDDIHLGFEIGARKLFTDYLDDVSSTYADENILLNGRGQTAVDLAFRGDELKTSSGVYPAEGTTRGNVKKDMYYYGQFRIGFRMSWFDNSSRRISCPKKL